jgi:hypothetical protein
MDGVRSRLEPDERAQLAQLLRIEHRRATELAATVNERDALIRALRWGHGGRAPVKPEALTAATRCEQYPTGLSRTTVHRIVGRIKDRPTEYDPAQHDDDERST